ncbi:MAG: hypothetical protein U9R10_03695 [Euryarchaeota archaeon]|nr:hypothetical protein [Euryarchaeota archaeon]
MNTTGTNSAWTTKGATLSDKSARKEFGVTQDEIIDGINDGKLQYRVNYVYDNPYYKLIRSEVEAFVADKYGDNYLTKKRNKNELAQINKELKKLKAQVVALEQRKIEVLASLE